MSTSRQNYFKSNLNLPKPQSSAKSVRPNQLKAAKSISFKQYLTIEEYQYAQQDLLGSGYTSKVYLGHLIDNPRKKVAIKVVDRSKICKQKEMLELLKQQMIIHQQLDHPNIVKCFKIVEKGNHYYFILEYCPEGTLQKFIKQHQRLAESTTVTVMEQIISAYKHLIDLKVLHRDLKPPNILKSGFNWKICDFGFSVIGKKHLIGNINVGTPTYMAPEALQRTYYSTKTDIFSIGVICYQMLFGKVPWQHKEEQTLLQMMQERITEDHLSQLSNRNLIQFILRCCEPNPNKRMNLEEFKQFSFWKEYQPKLQSLKPTQGDSNGYSKATNKTINTTRECSLSVSCCPSEATILSTSNLNQNENQTNEQIFALNKAKLQKDLEVCEIILILMKNYFFLPLSDEIQKDLFLTVLSRHSSYILRKIINNKFNCLRLKRWKTYSQSQTYNQSVEKAKQILQKIEAFMKIQARRKNIITIRMFNKRFDDLTYDRSLSEQCIQNLKEYIEQIGHSYSKDYAFCGPEMTEQISKSLSKYLDYLKIKRQSQEEDQLQTNAEGLQPIHC